LVCAPAGYGKCTLLAQMVANIASKTVARSAAVQMAPLPPDDDDAIRTSTPTPPTWQTATSWVCRLDLSMHTSATWPMCSPMRIGHGALPFPMTRAERRQ
jgi:Ni2+-binding GTPase involved in maturation of urease and hydrogenase